MEARIGSVRRQTRQERGEEKDELGTSYEEKRGKTFELDSDLSADEDNEDGEIDMDKIKKTARSREEPETACTSCTVSPYLVKISSWHSYMMCFACKK